MICVSQWGPRLHTSELISTILECARCLQNAWLIWKTAPPPPPGVCRGIKLYGRYLRLLYLLWSLSKSSHLFLVSVANRKVQPVRPTSGISSLSSPQWGRARTCEKKNEHGVNAINNSRPNSSVCWRQSRTSMPPIRCSILFSRLLVTYCRDLPACGGYRVRQNPFPTFVVLTPLKVSMALRLHPVRTVVCTRTGALARLLHR